MTSHCCFPRGLCGPRCHWEHEWHHHFWDELQWLSGLRAGLWLLKMSARTMSVWADEQFPGSNCSHFNNVDCRCFHFDNVMYNGTSDPATDWWLIDLNSAKNSWCEREENRADIHVADPGVMFTVLGENRHCVNCSTRAGSHPTWCTFQSIVQEFMVGRRDRLVSTECTSCMGFGLGTASLVVLEVKAKGKLWVAEGWGDNWGGGTREVGKTVGLETY